MLFRSMFSILGKSEKTSDLFPICTENIQEDEPIFEEENKELNGEEPESKNKEDAKSGFAKEDIEDEKLYNIPRCLLNWSAEIEKFYKFQNSEGNWMSSHDMVSEFFSDLNIDSIIIFFLNYTDNMKHQITEDNIDINLKLVKGIVYSNALLINFCKEDMNSKK